MSPLTRTLGRFAIGCAFLAVVAAGCSDENGAPFDPASGHPDDFRATHPAAYRDAQPSCGQCHGSDLSGGIAQVSCSTGSFEGQACHGGGPGGAGGQHPDGWRNSHKGTSQGQASSCARCHDNPDNALSPGCFNGSLCHGGSSGGNHPSGWVSSHKSTSQSQADSCAQCHRKNPGTAGCFNNTLCHGGSSGGNHPSGWRSSHRGTSQSQASTCAQCHRKNSGTAGCFNNTLCHGADDDD